MQKMMDLAKIHQCTGAAYTNFIHLIICTNVCSFALKVKTYNVGNLTNQYCKRAKYENWKYQ